MKKMIIAVAALLCLAACSSPTMTVALDQEASAQYAGIYAAVKQGYYQEAGLDVQIKYVDAGKGFDALQKGEANIIDEPLLNAVFRKGKDGIDIVNFLQTSQASSLIVISQQEISEFYNLQGKKIGYVDNGNDLLVRALTAIKGMNVEWVKVADYHDFQEKKVDAYITPYYGDVFYLASAGSVPAYIYSMTRMGFDIPDDGYYTLGKTYNAHRDAFKKFAAATVKGWAYCDSCKTDAVNLVMDEIGRRGVKGDYEHQNWILTQVLKYQTDPIAKKKTYLLFEETEDAASSVLVRAKMIDSPVSVLPDRKSAPGSTGVSMDEKKAIADSLSPYVNDSTSKPAATSASKK
jgi:ABC-type nitrate/sulfonate/bicarbonate transport system substrate-binding protein